MSRVYVGLDGRIVENSTAPSFVGNSFLNDLLRTRGRWGSTDPRRSIEDECGYPSLQTPIAAERYEELYRRFGIARRVVQVIPRECFQVCPWVYEQEESEESTEFEKAWDDLGSMLRPQSRFKQEEGSPVLSTLCDLYVQSGIGRYAVLLLGLDDGQPLDRPVKGWKEDNSMPASRSMAVPSFNGPYSLTANAKGRKLLYLRVFPEHQAEVLEYEANPTSPRYQQPTMYQLAFADPAGGGVGAAGGVQQRVHWSRVVHLGSDTDGPFGTPRMEPVWERLLDLRKVYSANGESNWRNAILKLFFETHPNLTDAIIDREGLKGEFEAMMNGLQQWMAVTGGSIKPIAPAVVDPTPHADAHIQFICVTLGIPKRIFMGSERGELASSQDQGAWNERLKHWQNNYVTPCVIAPFVDRLIAAGVLPDVPEYRVDWPDLTAQTDQEKAAIVVSKTQALAQYVADGVETLVAPLDYLTRFHGFTEEEAEAMLEASAEVAEENLALEQEQAELDHDRQVELTEATGGGGEEEQAVASQEDAQ